MGLGDRYLERMTVIPAGAETLEGLYHSGRRLPSCVVAPPHPRMGGSMDSIVCAQLAWAMTRDEHATLRFNYQGVGASTGEASGELKDAGDLRAAVDSLVETVGGGRVALIGYSFGAFLSAVVAAGDERVSHCVLVAPPITLFPFELDAVVARGAALVAILAQEDPYSPVAEASATVEAAGGVAHVVTAADHFFNCGLSEVGHLAAAALR